MGNSFVCIGTSDLLKRLMGTDTQLIVLQFGRSRQSPLSGQSPRRRGKFTANRLAVHIRTIDFARP